MMMPLLRSSLLRSVPAAARNARLAPVAALGRRSFGGHGDPRGHLNPDGT
eukprot:CAMPEP_0206446398 /NCGR_PEP_ID=MMETSP0324_2-20121206/16108_1 /ASSEMBLY_ACC=CAM_ASM_000836 /TAXON_ID=2866 /ORGANISM="Crypthecodinium cohnii, Strain Seligo" /LENGTH=49 /DNA_ID= /DNA_START= /DNA_END= /DNA_ORIENTATION=